MNEARRNRAAACSARAGCAVRACAHAMDGFCLADANWRCKQLSTTPHSPQSHPRSLSNALWSARSRTLHAQQCNHRYIGNRVVTACEFARGLCDCETQIPRPRVGVWSDGRGPLLIPVQVTMLPLFLLLKEMGLVNSYWGAIIPSIATIFGIFLIRQYALGIPDDLLDAARVDGASEFRIYWSIVLPVIRPILATLAIWTFLASWNDFLWPLVVLTDSSR